MGACHTVYSDLMCFMCISLSHIAIFVLKRDVKLQLTNSLSHCLHCKVRIDWHIVEIVQSRLRRTIQRTTALPRYFLKMAIKQCDDMHAFVLRTERNFQVCNNKH